MSYTKLANSILTSTIWMEDDHTRIVWFALLAMADRNGEVQASIPGLANVARVPLESCKAAIFKFLSPDPYSRTKDDEGRRLEEIKGGWLLVNHAEYRELASDDDRKRKAADRQQRFREKLRRNSIVTPLSRQIPQAEAEAKAEAKATGKSKDMSGLPDVAPLPAKPKRFEEARPILQLLNELTGSHFREVDSNLSLITARLEEPDVSADGVKLMVQRQVAKWKTDPKMADFLRPETLFGKQKFDSYYAARELPIQQPIPTNGNGTNHPSVRKPHRNDVIAGANDPARLAYNAHWDAIAEERDAYGGLTKEQWDAAAARDAAEAAASTGQPGVEEGRACL